MKSLLLFLMILFAGFTFGQKPEKGAPAKEKVKKEVSKNMKGKKGADQDDEDEDDKQKGKGNKPEKKGKDHDDDDDDDDDDNDDNKDKVKGKDKEHPGKGHAYGKNKGELSGREFGMTRAGKTVKGEDIKSDDEAKEVITEVKEENTKVITEVQSKLEKAADVLKQKKEAGEISEEEYIVKTTALELLKQKEAALKEKILSGGN